MNMGLKPINWMTSQLLLTPHDCGIIHHTNWMAYKAYASDKIYQQNEEGGWHGFLTEDDEHDEDDNEDNDENDDDDNEEDVD